VLGAARRSPRRGEGRRPALLSNRAPTHHKESCDALGSHIQWCTTQVGRRRESNRLPDIRCTTYYTHDQFLICWCRRHHFSSALRRSPTLLCYLFIAYLSGECRCRLTGFITCGLHNSAGDNLPSPIYFEYLALGAKPFQIFTSFGPASQTHGSPLTSCCQGFFCVRTTLFVVVLVL